jgi:hypothetical protein
VNDKNSGLATLNTIQSAANLAYSDPSNRPSLGNGVNLH